MLEDVPDQHTEDTIVIVPRVLVPEAAILVLKLRIELFFDFVRPKLLIFVTAATIPLWCISPWIL